MTDVNDRIRRAMAEAGGADAPLDGQPETLAAADPELLEVAELLFFAYRDFTSEPDAILAEIGFGRAHHRVLHFVNRYPGLRVADLLVILNITKQSLGRVLKQLVDEEFVVQKAGEADRRERLLYPTARGKALADRLAAPQLERLARALAAESGGNADSVRRFLCAMISPEDRPAVSELLASAGGQTRDRG